MVKFIIEEDNFEDLLSLSEEQSLDPKLSEKLYLLRMVCFCNWLA